MSLERQKIVDVVWREKYRWTQSDGTSRENLPEDSFHRVVKGIYAKDPDPQAKLAALHAMIERLWCPAGRIHAGAGTANLVTLLNCYVLNSIGDSMDSNPIDGTGIMDSLKNAALTQQMGGGIGQDFSTIRPKGAIVKRTGSISDGTGKFMDMWNAMCETVMSSGSRRGAMMGVLADSHPDILDFIEAKRKAGRWTNFNVSVLVSDALMEAVARDANWMLGFPIPPANEKQLTTLTRNGKPWYVYGEIPARELFEKITRNTYDWAEPGLIFIDRVNRTNNLYYCEDIRATNPCLVGETWIETEAGPKQIIELLNQPTKVKLDGLLYDAPKGFLRSGTKAILRLRTVEGFEVRGTADHRFQRDNGEWASLGELEEGDQLRVNEHLDDKDHTNSTDWSKGYLLGHLFGDGWVGDDRAALQINEDDSTHRNYVSFLHETAYGASPAWGEVGGSGAWVLRSRPLRELCQQLKIEPTTKRITPELEKSSPDFLRGFVSGFFDTDGSVQGSTKKGRSVRLAQSDYARLQGVQRILLRQGIYGKIYLRGPSGTDIFGEKTYDTKAQYELIITADARDRFGRIIGFRRDDKKRAFELQQFQQSRLSNRTKMVATVQTVEEDGVEEVYDVQVPGMNAFDANGFISHNCGEQPLPPHGACDLGAVNLARLATAHFQSGGDVNWERLKDVVAIGTRFLDNVLDVSHYPLVPQAEEALTKRRIGLGITGLANLLQLLRVRYGSPEALKITARVMEVIRDEAYRTSIELAKERGPFPAFDKDSFLKAEFVKTLPEELQQGIADHGIRNGVLLTIAPTGTTSIYYDNVSSGLEPVFAHSYGRKVRMPDDIYEEFEVQDYGYRLYCQEHPQHREGDPLPAYMATALELPVQDHLSMMALCQQYVDASISKTINCPADMPYEDFRNVYLDAYRLGLKGCTTYRPSGIRGEVLSVKAKEVFKVKEQLQSRPDQLTGTTYKIKWPFLAAALYVTINNTIEEDGTQRPFEIFVNTKAAQHQEWLAALTRLTSAVFRRGGDVTFLVDELEQVHSANGGGYIPSERKFVPSLVALIGMTVRKHFVAIGLIEGEEAEKVKEEVPPPGSTIQVSAPLGEFCPRCSAPTFIRKEGCTSCLSCSYSTCG